MEKARKVRWAMSMAIDRQTIIDTVLGGFGAPVYNSHMHSQFPPGSPLYKDRHHLNEDGSLIAAEYLKKDARYSEYLGGLQ